MARPKRKIDDVEIKKIETSLKKLQATASHPLKPLWPIIQSLIANGHSLGDIHAHLGGDGITLDRRSLVSLVRTMDGSAGKPKSGSEKERAAQPKISPAPKADAVSPPRDGSSIQAVPKPVDGAGPAQPAIKSEMRAARPVVEGGETLPKIPLSSLDGARPVTSPGDDVRDQIRSAREATLASVQRAHEQLQWSSQTTPRAEVASRDEHRMRETRLEDRPFEAARRFDSSTGGGA